MPRPAADAPVPRPAADAPVPRPTADAPTPRSGAANFAAPPRSLPPILPPILGIFFNFLEFLTKSVTESIIPPPSASFFLSSFGS